MSLNAVFWAFKEEERLGQQERRGTVGGAFTVTHGST